MNNLPCRGTALVVDDNSINRLVLGKLLDLQGYKVLSAEDGVKAVEIFGSSQVDIVFMDILMPNMDGYEATRLIKAKAGDEFVPVIFLTAADDIEILVNALGSGGDDLLVKPFNLSVLNARIKVMERVRELNRSLAEKHATLSALHEQVINDQEFAHKIFKRVLVQNSQASKYIHFFQRSAAFFCGDLVLLAELPDGRVRLLVADFTGHGLGAAVGTIPVADLFRRANENGWDDFSLLEELNILLYRLMPPEVFMAACLVTLGKDGFLYWNGGMPPSYLKSTDNIEELVSSHLALGVLPALTKDDRPQKIDYQKFHALVIASDGLMEAQNDESEQLGESSIYQCLLSSDHDAEALLGSLEKLATAHVDHSELKDDVSVAVIDLKSYLQSKTANVGPVFVKSMKIEFQGSALSSLNSSAVDSFLTGYEVGPEDLSAIKLVTNELLNNAVDHGVLKLESTLKQNQSGFSQFYEIRNSLLSSIVEGRVSLSFALYRYQEHPNQMMLEITVTDSGDGFPAADWNCLGSFQGSKNSNTWGRGVSIVKELCVQLEYNSIGNSAKAVYTWELDPALSDRILAG